MNKICILLALAACSPCLAQLARFGAIPRDALIETNGVGKADFDNSTNKLWGAVGSGGGGISPDGFVRINEPIDITNGNIRLGGGVSARQINLGANYAPGNTNTSVYFVEGGMIRDGQAKGATLGWPQWTLSGDRIATIRDITYQIPPPQDLSPYMRKFPEPMRLFQTPWELNIYQTNNNNEWWRWNSIILRSDDYESKLQISTRHDTGWWENIIGENGVYVSYDDNDDVGKLNPTPGAYRKTNPNIWASMSSSGLIVSRVGENPNSSSVSWLMYPKKSGTLALLEDVQGGGGVSEIAFPDVATNLIHRIVVSNSNWIVVSEPTP